MVNRDSESLKFSQLGLILIALMISVSCTRKAADSSSLSLSVPRTKSVLASGKVGALSGVLSHVVINITGTGISQPIVFSWDACRDCQSSSAAPADYQFTVPLGNKLVQVLAVYEDETNRRMQFYYGDSSISAGAGQVPVPVAVSALGVGQTVLSGRISGRYLTAPNVGPTGQVYIKYNPGAGKPGIIIEKSSIINGWFQFFGLSNVSMTYEVQGPQAQTLFGGSKSLESFTTSPQVFMSWQPLMWRSQGGGGDVELEDPGINVQGYFGDAAAISGKKVCYNDLSGDLDRLTIRQDGTDTPGDYISTLNAALPAASLASLLLPENENVYYAGGAGGSIGSFTTCKSGGTKYQDYLEVVKVSLNGQGNDAMAGFNFPMQWLTSFDRRSVQITALSSTQRSVTGIVLPGVQAIMTSMTFYKRTGVGYDDEGGDDELECATVRKPDSGFVPAGTASIALANGNLNGILNLTDADIASGTMVAACGSGPFGDLPTARIIRPWQVRGDVNVSGPYVLLQFSGNGSASAATGPGAVVLNGSYSDTCLAVTARAYENSSALMITGTPLTVDLNGAGDVDHSFGLFYSDATCTTPKYSVVIDPGYENSTENLYFQATANVTDAQFDKIEIDDPAARGFVFAASTSLITVVAEPTFELDTATRMLPNICYRVRASLKLGSSNYDTYESSATLAGGAGASFFASEATCRTGSPTSGTANISAPSSNFEFWIKPGASTDPFYATLLGRNSSTITPVMGPPSGTPLEIQRLIFEYPSPFKAGQCLTAKIKVVNKDEYEIPTFQPLLVTINVDRSRLAVYNSPGCMSGITDSIIIDAGQTSKTFYLKASTTSSVGITVAAGGLSLYAPGGSQVVSITPVNPGAAENYIYLTPPTLNTQILGSHNFPVGGIEIPVVITPAASDIFCRYSTNGSNWTECGASRWNSSTSKFYWQAADSLAGPDLLQVQFSYKYDGNHQSLSFEPHSFYAVYGREFRVAGCTSTYAAGGHTTTFINSEMAANPGPPKFMCFADGAFVTYATESISSGITDSGSAVHIVGYVNLSNPATLSSRFDIPLDSSIIDVPSGGGAEFEVANMRFLQGAGEVTAAHSGIRIAGAGSRTVRSTNNLYEFPAGVNTPNPPHGAYGINRYQTATDVRLISTNDRFQIGAQATGDLVVGFKTGHLPYPGSVEINGASFSVGNGSANATGLMVFDTNSGGTIEIRNSQFSGYRTLAEFDGTENAAAWTNIFNSRFEALNGVGTTPGINILNGAIAMETVELVNHIANRPAVAYYSMLNSIENVTFKFLRSRVTQYADASAFYFLFDDAGGGERNINFYPEASHFVYLGSSAVVPTLTAEIGAGGALALTIYGNNISGPADNRICHGGAQPWNGFIGLLNSATSGVAQSFTSITPSAATAAPGPYSCD